MNVGPALAAGPDSPNESGACRRVAALHQSVSTCLPWKPLLLPRSGADRAAPGARKIGIQFFAVWLVVFGVVRAWAATASSEVIAEAEVLQPPTAARLASVVATAQREGWPRQVPILRAAARLAYQREKLPAAEAWHDAQRWAELLGRTDTEFIARWIPAVEAARVGHPNMPSRYTPEGRPLGAALSAELQGWLVGNAAFAQEFFNLIAPVDYLPAVLSILEQIYRAGPARFKASPSLALAIAVVYDVAPPPIWPHGQVSATALPRKLPSPVDAFAWWTKQEQLGRSYHKLSRLGADELKFVVDAAAPFAELEWTQTNVTQPLESLASAYAMVRYRNDRVTANVPVWPGRTYQLSEILAEGGICADQAYFATEVGKARGVPTLLIYGAGNDGRHAWFGFLDGSRKWQLDAGRYAEQRFVTGYVRDPQTWGEFSDHELKFLSERFRDLPSYRQSRIHAAFAADYLATREAPVATVAARKAVNFERRNLAAWELLLAALKAGGGDARAQENAMREAAIAFQRYPDLEAMFVNRVSASLRARGDTSAAEAEERRIARKNQGNRSDLAVQQARDIVVRAIATQPLPERIRAYNSVVDSFGRGSGTGFFDQVVTVFVEHLVQQQRPAEARQAIARARQVLAPEPRSQLDQELTRLAERVGAGK